MDFIIALNKYLAAVIISNILVIIEIFPSNLFPKEIRNAAGIFSLA